MKEEKEQEGWKSNTHSYVKYTGLGFQLLGLILIGYWLGSWIDSSTGTTKPYWTAGIIALFIIAFLVSMIYKLSKR